MRSNNSRRDSGRLVERREEERDLGEVPSRARVTTRHSVTVAAPLARTDRMYPRRVPSAAERGILG